MAPSHLSPILDDQSLDRVVAQLRDRGVAIGANGNGSMKRDLVKWVLEIALAVVVAWGTVNTRIAVLEARFDDMRSSIADIQKDVKTLLQRNTQ